MIKEVLQQPTKTIPLEIVNQEGQMPKSADNVSEIGYRFRKSEMMKEVLQQPTKMIPLEIVNKEGEMPKSGDDVLRCSEITS